MAGGEGKEARAATGGASLRPPPQKKRGGGGSFPAGDGRTSEKSAQILIEFGRLITWTRYIFFQLRSESAYNGRPGGSVFVIGRRAEPRSTRQTKNKRSIRIRFGDAHGLCLLIKPVAQGSDQDHRMFRRGCAYALNPNCFCVSWGSCCLGAL